jgi:flagellar biosynthesis protein FlhG
VRRSEPDDQAAGLRRLLGEQNSLRPLGLIGPDTQMNAAAACALAHALAQRGGKVGIIDEAPAPHNVAGQHGLAPRLGLSELARGGHGFDEILADLPDGLRLLRAELGLTRTGEADDRLWSRLVDDFAGLAWDWLLLTAPADDRPSLALAAPQRILVLPAAKSRLTEAYALLKAAHNRQPDATWLALFMNAADNERAEQLMAALNETTHRFLGVDVELLGSIPKDAQLDMAIRSMRPLHQIAPSAPATVAFRQIADHLNANQASEGVDARIFWQRLGLFSRMNRAPRPQPTRHQHHGRVYG